MRSLIVYSSLTGNTQKIAEAIYSIMPAGTDIFHVKKAPSPDNYDLICLGFWVDKGAPDAAMLKYMEKIKNKKIGLFGTLGAWPDSDHAKESMKRAYESVKDNKILGSFLCQGKIDPKILEVMAKMTNSSKTHPMTEERKARIEEAKKHPNEEDCIKAKESFKQILELALY